MLIHFNGYNNLLSRKFRYDNKYAANTRAPEALTQLRWSTKSDSLTTFFMYWFICHLPLKHVWFLFAFHDEQVSLVTVLPTHTLYFSSYTLVTPPHCWEHRLWGQTDLFKGWTRSQQDGSVGKGTGHQPWLWCKERTKSHEVILWHPHKHFGTHEPLLCRTYNK